MKLLKLLSLSASVMALTLSSSMVHGFSFDFDNDDGPPSWVESYWQPAPRYYYPQMDSFDRSRVVEGRQRHMQRRASTMSQLSNLLSGRYGFDRAQAVQLARNIERSAGWALTRNFHPGAVIDTDSRTTRSLWGNEQMFRANAETLQSAARALAEELEKTPTAEQGAVYLRTRSKPGDDEVTTAAVSSQVWQKYSDVSNTCHACHRNFRSPFD
jgi:cytochrome c556